LLSHGYMENDMHMTFRYQDSNGDWVHFFNRYNFDLDSMVWQIELDP